MLLPWVSFRTVQMVIPRGTPHIDVYRIEAAYASNSSGSNGKVLDYLTGLSEGFRQTEIVRNLECEQRS